MSLDRTSAFFLFFVLDEGLHCVHLLVPTKSFSRMTDKDVPIISSSICLRQSFPNNFSYRAVNKWFIMLPGIVTVKRQRTLSPPWIRENMSHHTLCVILFAYFNRKNIVGVVFLMETFKYFLLPRVSCSSCIREIFLLPHWKLCFFCVIFAKSQEVNVVSQTCF